MRGTQGAPPAALGPAVAQGCAAALLGGAVPAAADDDLQRVLLGDLFPGCCYLALAACSLPPGAAAPCGSTSRSACTPLLLSGNLLAPRGVAGGAPGVHATERSMAGSSMLIMRPKALAVPAAAGHGGRGGSNGDSSPPGTLFTSMQLARFWSDVAGAQRHWGASDFLCLPFQLMPDSGGSQGQQRGNSSALALALLLGAPPVAPGGQQRRAQQRQHMRSMLQLVAALVRHAVQDLRAASEVLRVLQPRSRSPPPLEPVPEGDEEEEWESSSGEEPDSPSRPAAEAAVVAAVAGEQAPQPAAGAAGSWAEARAEQPSAPAAGTLEPAGPASSAGQPRSRHALPGALAVAAAPHSSALQQTSSAESLAHVPTPPLLHDAPTAAADPALAPAAAPAAALPLLARARQVGQLAWLTARQTVALPRALHLDPLLRFRGAGGGAAVGAGAGGGGAARPPALGPALEREFLAYHSAVMANKMDAAAALILLSILILLAKEPAAQLRIGHPLFCALTACLALPLLALVPGTFRNWYVARRERVLLLFFACALLYQQATTNHLRSHVLRAAQSRYVNAGFAWITVDGLLLQMRFCRQLPALLLCFLVNMGVAPAFCQLYHAHLPPSRCLVHAVWRGLLCLAAPLALLYLLELRLRRDFFLQRRDAAAREEAALVSQRQQLRAERLEERRRTERRTAPAAADAGT